MDPYKYDLYILQSELSDLMMWVRYCYNKLQVSNYPHDKVIEYQCLLRSIMSALKSFMQDSKSILKDLSSHGISDHGKRRGVLLRQLTNEVACVFKRTFIGHISESVMTATHNYIGVTS